MHSEGVDTVCHSAAPIVPSAFASTPALTAFRGSISRLYGKADHTPLQTDLDAREVDDEAVNVDLRHAILMIARALDYVAIDDFNHGHRVGFIAYECAKRLGFSESRQEFSFFAGLLHDCGVSSVSEHERLIAKKNPAGLTDHCIRGHNYLDNCLVLRSFAPACRYHHTPWKNLRDRDLDPADRDAAALIFLADRVDALRAQVVGDDHPDSIILHGEQIAAEIQKHAGTLFHPDYCEAMIELVRIEGFWFSMNRSFIEGIGDSLGRDGSYDMHLKISEVINLATFLSRIVDAKSPFTVEHSERVAQIAMKLARILGLSSWEQKQILVSGLLHDVGKLRVPDEILHKQGKLDDTEFSQMKRHSVDTRLALQWCFKDSPIVDWAANHHERLDGTGYPYRLSGDQLDLPSRILAVADIFQALAQNRPYRGRLDFEQIMAIMVPMAERGGIDAQVLAAIQDRPDAFYTLATA